MSHIIYRWQSAMFAHNSPGSPTDPHYFQTYTADHNPYTLIILTTKSYIWAYCSPTGP